MTKTTLEQQARDILERMDIEGAQSFTAGEVSEIGNLLNEIARLKLPKHCKTCKFWTPYDDEFQDAFVTDEKKAGGICKNEKIREDWWKAYEPDELVYPFNEGGHFWTGPQFGCVHHTSK